MNRACCSVGKTTGWGGKTPLQAICNVVQIAFCGVACATIARHVADDADIGVHRGPAGMSARRDRDGIDVDAVDVAGGRIGRDRGGRQRRVGPPGSRAGAARRLDDHERMVGVERRRCS